MRVATGVFALLLGASFGCADDPPTEIAVVVSEGSVPLPQLPDTLVLDVSVIEGSVERPIRTERIAAGATSGRLAPWTVIVRPEGASTAALRVFRVRALVADATYVEVSHRTAFLLGHRLTLPIRLHAACVMRSCDRQETCDGEGACRNDYLDPCDLDGSEGVTSCARRDAAIVEPPIDLGVMDAPREMSLGDVGPDMTSDTGADTDVLDAAMDSSEQDSGADAFDATVVFDAAELDTASVLDGGVCDGCAIGGVCWADGASDPANACNVCDVGRSATGWVSRTCDDGFSCTIDTCAAGMCAHEIVGCLIGDRCYRAGEPVAGFFVGFCTICQPEISNTLPTTLTGERCDDESECTVGDTCEESGRCTGTIAADRCYVDGRCYAAGESVNGGCRFCDPTFDQRRLRNAPDETVCDFGGERCCQGVCFDRVNNAHCGECGRLCDFSTRCCRVGGAPECAVDMSSCDPT